MSIENLYANFDEIQQLGYTVQLLTDLIDPTVWTQIWFENFSLKYAKRNFTVCLRITQRSDAVYNNNVSNGNPELFGAVRATQNISPLSFAPTTYIV